MSKIHRNGSTRLVAAVQREQARQARRDELEVKRLRDAVVRRQRKLDQAKRNLAAALERQNGRNASSQKTGR